ncbi:MAG: TIGR01841 family phasin [Candidatus Symbiobacter sp.]|nr:TIGR01841 family phasin [Candidatus Symbiobacter sp.]
MNPNKPTASKTASVTENLVPNMFKDMFSNFKIPGLNLEQIAEHTRANFESLMKANQVAASGLNEIGKRQTEIFRQTLDQAMEIIKHGFEEMSHEQRLAKQTELTKLAFEKAMLNAKELAELATKSGKDTADIIQQRIKTSLEEIQKSAGGK